MLELIAILWMALQNEPDKDLFNENKIHLRRESHNPEYYKLMFHKIQ